MGTGIRIGLLILLLINPCAVHAQYSLTTLANFDFATTGASPQGALYADSNGDLFGTTYDGGTGNGAFGTVFQYSASAHEINVLRAFDGSNGGFPRYASLTADSQGNLYGAAGAIF